MALPANVPALESLELLSSVVRLGSLSAAAAEHGIAQPSASARIRQLERQVGVELLVRTPNGSSPTAAGLLVAERAKAILAGAEELLAAVAALGDGDRCVRVAASYTVAEHLLPGWLARFRAQRPATRVELGVVNSAGVVEQVRAGSVRLGFVEVRGSWRDLHSTVVGADRLVVVVGARHPWARRRKPVSAAMVAATPLITRELGSGTREVLEAAVRSEGLTMAVPALELGSTASVRSAVETGSAPAVLSDLAVADAVAAGRLVVVPTTGLDLGRSLRAVWRADARPDADVDALLAIARS